MSKKEEILRLRAEGKTYNEIVEIVGCGKSTVAYHCGEGVKQKASDAQTRRRSENLLVVKVEKFRLKKAKPKSCETRHVVSDNKKLIRHKVEDFQRRCQTENGTKLGKRNTEFRWTDVVGRFGENTSCYLSGRPINLMEPKTYQLDHIVPASRGGDNSFDNLGVACKAANQAKSDMTFEELLKLCEDILVNNGYSVEKIRNRSGVHEDTVSKTAAP